MGAFRTLSGSNEIHQPIAQEGDLGWRYLFTVVGVQMSLEAMSMDEVTNGMTRAGDKGLNSGAPQPSKVREKKRKDIEEETPRRQEENQLIEVIKRPSEEIIGRRSDKLCVKVAHESS